MEFPLYNELVQLETEPSFDHQTVCDIANSLTDEQSETLFALMLHHYIIEIGIDIKEIDGRKKLESISEQLIDSYQKKLPLLNPYGIKLLGSGRGLMIDIQNLPSSLRKIILNYFRQISH